MNPVDNPFNRWVNRNPIIAVLLVVGFIAVFGFMIYQMQKMSSEADTRAINAAKDAKDAAEKARQYLNQ